MIPPAGASLGRVRQTLASSPYFFTAGDSSPPALEARGWLESACVRFHTLR